MTSKKQKKAGFLLPTPITGYPLLCVTLKIPNKREYRAAFRGVLKKLTEWWTWEKSYEDGDTRASEAAFYWRDLLEEHLKIAKCVDPEPCPDCPKPDDDCLDLEDFLEDMCFDDLPELEDYMYYAAPFVGQLVAGVVPPTSGGWLLCNGSSVNKADYPELYQVLLGKVGEDTLTFNLPDFTDRIPMGAGTIVDVLAAAGESEHTLTTAEMPEHAHDASAHTHTTEPHTHLQFSHTHSTTSHVHTSPAHGHSVTDPGHTHNVPVRQDQATFGTGVIATGANATALQNRASASGTTGISIQTTGVTINPATVEVLAEIALNEDATVTVNSGGGGETSAAGDGEAFPIIPPVIGVNWFIFAGGKECC